MLIVIVVVAILMVPFSVWATRQAGKRRSRGIDWSRGLSEVAQHAREGARLLRQGDARGALGSLDRGLLLDPRHVESLVLRGSARHRLGDLDGALADYDRALDLGGPNAELLNDRGCLRRDRGELTQARADVEAALRLAPNDSTALVSLAEVFAHEGEWDQALASLRRGIALDPTWRDHARRAPALASLREARPGDSLFSAED